MSYSKAKMVGKSPLQGKMLVFLLYITVNYIKAEGGKISNITKTKTFILSKNEYLEGLKL